jgi:hypothetical protein
MTDRNTDDQPTKQTARSLKTSKTAKTASQAAPPKDPAPEETQGTQGTTSWKRVPIPKRTEQPLDSWVDEEVVDAVKNLTKPTIIDDIKSMYRGRTAWRKTATITETMGKASLATSTVLAFASASEIVNDSSSRILGFVAGSVGTLGLVLTSFANFARNQAIERTDAANMILGSVRVDGVPDINQELVISDGGGDQ